MPKQGSVLLFLHALDDSSCRKVSYVTRRVFITVVALFACWAFPFTHIEGHTPHNVTAPVAPLTARKPAVKDAQLFTVPLTLVSEHGAKFGETNIANILCEIPKFDHAANVQVFDRNNVVIGHHCRRHLMQVVTAGVTDLFVNAGHLNTLTVPTTTPFGFPREVALSLSELGGVLRSVAGVSDSGSVGQSSQPGNTQINTDGFAGLFLFQFDFVHHEGNEVFAGSGLSDGNGSGLGIKATRPYNVQRSDLSEAQNPAAILESGRSELSGLFVVLALKRGVLSPLVKEVFKGRLQVTKGLLQWNTRNFTKPFVFFRLFEVGEGCAGLVVADLVTRRVLVCTVAEKIVVRKPGMPKHLSQHFALTFGRVEPVFVPHFHITNIHNFTQLTGKVISDLTPVYFSSHTNPAGMEWVSKSFI